jgi:hypothetical protein
MSPSPKGYKRKKWTAIIFVFHKTFIKDGAKLVVSIILENLFITFFELFTLLKSSISAFSAYWIKTLIIEEIYTLNA